MIKRELYMEQIRPFIGTDLIKVMSGIRRSGKSVMLDLIKEELCSKGIKEKQFISYNFENMSYTRLCNANSLHEEVIKQAVNINEKVYLFFDEIQEVENWQKAVNSFRVELDCDIYITGSNAKLLSGELASVLGGRYVEFTIYPFSYAEFIELYKTIYPKTEAASLFQKYLTFGGMPYLANLNYAEEPCRQYLNDVYNSVVLNDVIKRNDIRDVDMLTRIIAYCINNVGTTFSATSIAKFLKNERRSTTSETVLNYINYCINSYLFYRVNRQDLQGKQLLSTNEKYYIADHGFREAIFGNNMRDINLILENIVFMELLRRGYNVTIGKTKAKEIDFVCQKRDQILYVQVAYLLATQETIDREFGVYDLIRDNFPKYVVTMDEINMSRNGIKHLNIRDFLLMSEWY